MNGGVHIGAYQRRVVAFDPESGNPVLELTDHAWEGRVANGSHTRLQVPLEAARSTRQMLLNLNELNNVRKALGISGVNQKQLDSINSGITTPFTQQDVTVAVEKGRITKRYGQELSSWLSER
jgi:hypothetical protein